MTASVVQSSGGQVGYHPILKSFLTNVAIVEKNGEWFFCSRATLCLLSIFDLSNGKEQENFNIVKCGNEYCSYHLQCLRTLNKERIKGSLLGGSFDDSVSWSGVYNLHKPSKAIYLLQ